MLAIVNVLGELLEHHFSSVLDGGRDCRLLVPGLTAKIARQLHDYLISKDIDSYLVVGKDILPKEEARLIRAEGLTSKRIGSFIVIASPGQLVRIQDSIRGTGGTIRSLAFSEEWPWIDNGYEPFRFDGPVLDTLVSDWSGDTREKKWLRELILKGLVRFTQASSRRTQFLLEDILGTFQPSLYPEIDDVLNKFIFHTGIPRTRNNLPNVSSLIGSTTRLHQKIVERCQKDEDVRNLARDMVDEVIPECERIEVKIALDYLLDGIGRRITTSTGLLGFYSCWGPDRNDPIHWQKLTADYLAKIFGVNGNGPEAVVSFNVTCHCDRAVIADSKNKLASFFGEEIRLEISYKIPPNQFYGITWEVQVLNRRRLIFERELDCNEGKIFVDLDTEACLTSYSRKIPVRIALLQDRNNVIIDDRVELNLCGEQRPAFTVVQPDFFIIDATPIDSDDTPDKKLSVDEPQRLYLFSHNAKEVRIYDENETRLDVIETEMNGIWQSRQLVDTRAASSGQVIRSCKFDNYGSVICFEARDLDTGEFTIEDELRVTISESKEKRIKELAGLFRGTSKKPYSALGKLNEAARLRIKIANLMTSPIGWRPLLVNVFKPSSQKAGSVGSFINQMGEIDGHAFRTLTLPEEAQTLLQNYSNTRDAILKEIEEFRIDNEGVSLEHPVYASYPIFSQVRLIQTDNALSAYLKAYYEILDYLNKNQNHIEWLQNFVLCYLDCVVHWDNSPLQNALFLLGPWHPLILAKRYMVQAALFSRAEQIIQRKDQKSLRHLASLLERVHGFRWLVGISDEDRKLEPLYVSATSDPGWHLAFKKNCHSLAIEQEIDGLAGVFAKIREIFGLTTEIVTRSGENLVTTCISNYLRAFPSRRSIGVRIRCGYSNSNIVEAVDRYLHSDDGVTGQGIKLPGGVRLYFEEAVNDTENVKWTAPSFLVYQFTDDEDCVRNEHPDIYMLPQKMSPSIQDANIEKFRLPRGTGLETIFMQELNSLTEGKTLVPKSVIYEFDACERTGDGVGGAFQRASAKIVSALGVPQITTCSVEFPKITEAPWVVHSGEMVDPAVLVKYVRDEANREIQERALWDYKFNITGKDTSFFVLSPIPRGFELVVKRFFGRSDIAKSFIVELGKVGISIGGDALKSGRHSLGVIGLVGAVRLFSTNGSEIPTPIVCNTKAVGFLIPVDSFDSFFGKVGSTQSGLGGKRADLLAVQLTLPQGEHGRIAISCCGIESKFTSRTLGNTRARDALEQAYATTGEFKMLVETSLHSGGIPERLGLLEILKFGLRIVSPSEPREIDKWLQTETSLYDAILSGNYEFCDPKFNGVLISTEEQLSGVAEHSVLAGGLWVRLTKEHWPAIVDTQQLNSIKQELSHLFDSCVEQATILNKTSTPKSLIDKVEAERDLAHKEINKMGESTSDIGKQRIQIDYDQETGSEANLEAEPLGQIFLGVDDGRRFVYFNPQAPEDPLDNKHLMVTGSSGTGKTQLLKYLICRVREQDKPVFILDLKNDFASDQKFSERSELDRIFLAFDGLPYNPLIPYPVRHPASGELFIQCGHHIAGVSSVLKRTYGLGAQQQAALNRAIVAAFASFSISTEGSVRYSEEMKFPDFSDVGEALQHDNPSAYNRLDPLFTLGLFRNEFRDSSFQSLVRRSAILDFSQIPSDEIKNALAQLIVLSAHAYYNSQPQSGTIRQFLVFDEAHRVLNSDYMLRLVREGRAYGVAILLSSQYPSDFPNQISASMATKVIHGNGRDIERVKNIIQLIGCEDRKDDVANLERFQAFVDNRHHPQTLVRTMNYPLYLVWTQLQELEKATLDKLAEIEGFDTSKLPIVNVVRQLERLGLVQERDGTVVLV